MNEVETHIYPLSQLYYYLTDGCNLACRHCWLAPKLDSTGTHSNFLPVELFQQSITEAKPLGLRGVKLTGGEPLLHPHFDLLVDIILREKLSMAIETNAVLCTPEIAKNIARIPSNSVSVSLDGSDEATHEWIRGVKGSFNAACRGIENLVTAGIRPQIIFSVMQSNSHQVQEIIHLAEELGASSVKYNVIQPTARGEKLHEQDLALTVAEYINVGQYVDRELSGKTKLGLYFDFPVAFRSIKYIASGYGCSVCGILHILGVLANGSYALCGIGEHIPGLVFGKIGEDPLKDVWYGNSVLNDLRENIPEGIGGICGRCLLLGVCKGACLAQNMYRSKKLLAPFWFCSVAEEEGLFPKSRIRI